MNKTLFLSPNSDQDSTEPQGEARMREALGLRTDGTRVTPSGGHRPERQADHGPGNARRHRFVQEGEVPVEVMTLRDHSSRAVGGPIGMPRHRVDESAILAEKSARENAERTCAELTERLREVQTKLGHAELARDEALALAARRQAQLDTLLAQPPPPPVPVPAVVAPPALPQFTLALDMETASAASTQVPVPRKAVAKPRGRVRVKAPQPVKWWIKSAPAGD